MDNSSSNDTKHSSISYRSQVNPGLGALLIALALSVPLSLGAALYKLSSSPQQALVFAIPGIFTALLLLLVVWPVRYTLEERELIIRFGVIRVRVPYRDIQEVSPTRTIIAGPALSLDRLWIQYKGGPALVSPVDKANFLRDLAARDPGLSVVGDRVVRRPGTPETSI